MKNEMTNKTAVSSIETPNNGEATYEEYVVWEQQCGMVPSYWRYIKLDAKGRQYITTALKAQAARAI